MFATFLELATRYDYLSPRFRAGYAWLLSHDARVLGKGAYPVCEGVTALVQRYTTMPESEAKDFGAHDHVFDFHYLVAGTENFGVCRREGLKVSVPYDAEKDILFFEKPEIYSMLTLKPGDFVAVPPEEAHRPRLAVNGKAGEVTKVVLKIAL